MKLKEKLIHWLGGYTVQNRINHNIVVTEKPIITLSTAMRFNKDHTEEKEYLKQKLVSQIADTMIKEEYIKFSYPTQDTLRADIHLIKFD